VTVDADELEIVALGARGDGIAQAPAGPRYVPFALPGELWRLTGDGGELLRPHPARATPPCGHFGACGGCAAQHMPADTYAAWKRDTVVQAFRHRGIDAPVAPLWRIAPASRRRVTLHARRQGGHVRLGFHRAATHDILDVTECAVAVPRIVAALPGLREMLGPVLSGRSEAAVTVVATAAGLDVHMTFTHLADPPSHYPALAALGARQGLARLTVGNDIVLQAARPVLVFGGVGVEPPAGAFVQAVEAAQEKMVEIALAAVGPARRVADLFCGLGAFTLALARRAQVLAVDGDTAAVTALGAAVRRAQGLKPVEAKVRDLFREPLGGKELQPFDAVVMDPPRQGAKAQAEQLARAQVPVIVVVSCDPGTLARDVRLLVDGGYVIDSVTPIDQFLFSAHVEAVAVLRRQRAHGAIN
jgi:23S rRNA (uracil1939-C5)-methyltransferase